LISSLAHRIVGFHDQENDVELVGERADITEVEGAHLHFERLFGHFDSQSTLSHRLDVLGPLIDQDDVMPGFQEVGADG
jgi:hypothetical protein